MLFDTHAHLTDRRFDEDRDALICTLNDRQIGLVMNPGCSLNSSRNADALSKAYEVHSGGKEKIILLENDLPDNF